MNNYPFTDFKNGIYRPYLPLRIINPHTDKSYKTFGLITTGADECIIPAFIAKALVSNKKYFYIFCKNNLLILNSKLRDNNEFFEFQPKCDYFTT
ncbi:MAG: hypothetical protein ACK41Q_13130, partial [Candidatus Brocadia sp.]